MRIIAGQRRGHKFDGPRAKADMRPTSDMVRESLFNIVGELMPGRVAVDLFAGTGALGLEALSRGADRAIFVEKDRENVGLIHRNIATLRYQDRTQVRLADAYRWARSFQPVEQAPLAVFLDPPYREYEIRRRQMSQMLGSLVEKLPAESVIVLEAGRDLDDEILPDLDSWDIRRYGDTQIAIRVLPGAAPEPGSEARLAVGQEPAADGRRGGCLRPRHARLRPRGRPAVAPAGFQALWAGGCVRDLILGLVPADYDVATDATPEQVMLTLPFRAITVGISFGVVRVRHPRMQGIEVEVATFRSDLRLRGRPPAHVGRLQLSRARRRPPRFHDQRHVHGPGIEPGDRLRGRPRRPAPPGPPRHRRPGGAIPRGQAPAAPRRPVRGPVRPHDRADHAGGRPGDGRRGRRRLARADRPGAAADARAREPGAGHGPGPRPRTDRRDPAAPGRDAGTLPGQADAAGGRPLGPHHAGAPAPAPEAQLHAGLRRPGPRRGQAVHPLEPPGRTSFHNHDQVGSRIADRLCQKLRFSNAERERITWLVAFHQYLGEAKKLREAKLKRVLAQPGIDELLALHRADALASTGDTEHVDYCAYYLEHQPAGPINPPPLLTGHDLVRHGLEPGAQLCRDPGDDPRSPARGPASRASERPSNGSITTWRPDPGPTTRAAECGPR